ncbi:MAG: SO2930 family diheme c-type cytochrome [Kofleriaceae bacterium]
MKYVLFALLAACGDNHECSLDGPMCDRLSDYGFFADIATQTPAPGVTPYELDTPLFSDYATKQRFIYLPTGSQMQWSDDDAFDLPYGAALIKTFSYAKKLETRVLIHGSATSDDWHGASYIYNGEDGDAVLASAGGVISTSVDTTVGPEQNDYVVPNENQCKNCHAEHDDIVTPLGPKARHINVHDQLQAFVANDLLAGAPDPSTWPKDPVATDPGTGTLDARARAFLDINCGHCHNPTGQARTSGLYLDAFETDQAKFGVCKPPVATGRGSGGLAYDIVPGQPDASIMIYRVSSTEPSIKMPEVGRNLVYSEGLQLLRDWISAMPGQCK